MHIDTIKLLYCISTYIIIVQNEEYAFQDIYNKVITNKEEDYVID